MNDRAEDHADRIGAAITEAAKLMHTPFSLEEMLDSIVQATLETVPGFNHVGISLTHRSGQIETLSGTDQLVWELDAIQYELAEGPSYEAVRGEEVVVVENARHDQRWPRYMPQAAQKGLRAQLGIGLYSNEETIGGLNLYSTESDTIDADALHIAEMFATHAALALGRSRQEQQLGQAIASRKVIGQAVGILMERYQLEEQRAFQFLIRASQTSNVKLRIVAQELVGSTNAKFTQG